MKQLDKKILIIVFILQTIDVWWIILDNDCDPLKVSFNILIWLILVIYTFVIND